MFLRHLTSCVQLFNMSDLLSPLITVFCVQLLNMSDLRLPLITVVP